MKKMSLRVVYISSFPRKVRGSTKASFCPRVLMVSQGKGEGSQSPGPAQDCLRRDPFIPKKMGHQRVTPLPTSEAARKWPCCWDPGWEGSLKSCSKLHSNWQPTFTSLNLVDPKKRKPCNSVFILKPFLNKLVMSLSTWQINCISSLEENTYILDHKCPTDNFSNIWAAHSQK